VRRVTGSWRYRWENPSADYAWIQSVTQGTKTVNAYESAL
jgi:hypothetical protein